MNGVCLRTRVYLPCFLFLCVMTAGLFSGCSSKVSANTIHVNLADSDGFKTALAALFPDYALVEHDKIVFDMMPGGGVIEAYDAQTSTARDGGIEKHWTPLTLETVVIAVDRSQTDMPITSWSDLRDSAVPVGIPYTDPFEQLAVAALCWGLEGKGFSLAPLVRLGEPLNADKKLKLGDPDAPVRLCFDSEAAARVRNGENIEIIIPSEGTLSFARGLFSDQPLALPDDYEQILLDHGLRLTDGRCPDANYPPSGQYASATVLDDYDHLNTVMQDWTRTLRRQVQHTRLYSSADGFEHVMFPTALIVFAVVWATTMMRRVRQKNIRRIIPMMGLLAAGWILARIVKFQVIETNALTRYIWYSYYLFQSLLTLGLLRTASLVGVNDEEKQLPKWLLATGAFNLALVGIAMTNDLHNWMFILDLSTPGWSGNYGQGFFYYFYVAALLTQLISGILIMFVKSRSSPRRFGVAFPLAFIAVLATYVAGYAARIPFFWESDPTLVMCVLGLLFVECCVRAGLIPVNLHYRKLFKNAGLKLQIKDGGGNSIYASDGAELIDALTWDKLKNSDVPVRTDENTLFLRNEISGGYAVWQEDITSINRLKAEIEAANEHIEAANAILATEARRKEREGKAKAKLELYAAFEKNLADHEDRLEYMLRSIAQDSQGESFLPISESERAAHMGAVAVLACYIKRRCNLLALEMSGETSVSWSGLTIYIDELTEFAKLTGIQAIHYCNLSGDITLHRAAVFYRFFALALEEAITNENAGIAAHTVREDGQILMKLLVSGETVKLDLPPGIADEIREAGGAFEKKDLGAGLAGLYLSFPEGGEGDA